MDGQNSLNSRVGILCISLLLGDKRDWTTSIKMSKYEKTGKQRDFFYVLNNQSNLMNIGADGQHNRQTDTKGKTSSISNPKFSKLFSFAKLLIQILIIGFF